MYRQGLTNDTQGAYGASEGMYAVKDYTTAMLITGKLAEQAKENEKAKKATQNLARLLKGR